MLAGAAVEPAAPAKLKLLKAPAAGVLATAAGALAAALAAPEAKENAGELGGTGAAASDTHDLLTRVLRSYQRYELENGGPVSGFPF